MRKLIIVAVMVATGLFGAVQNVSASSTSGGTVTGTVTNAAGGAPLSGVTVQLTSYPNDCGSSGISTTTATDGTWSIPVASGTYYVCFSLANFATQYWDNTTNYQNAQPITVTSSTVSGINAAMAAYGLISGTVTNAAGGAPLGGVGVSVSQYPGNCYASTTTVSDGTWVIAEPPGIYFVCFSLSGFAAQYWDNTTNYQNAQPVNVSSGANTSGINAALAADGTISGTVKAAVTGLALRNVAVSVSQSSYSCGYASTYTAADGTWSIPETPGTYFVCFSYGGYVTQFWKNSNPQPVTVTSGINTPGINATMVAYGTISGTVTAAVGAPLSGVSVSVFASAGGNSNNAYTAADGTWSVSEPPGTYYVSFSLNNYASQYWKNTSNFQNAKAITITSGSTVSAINAALVADGTVSGTVTIGGAPQGGVSVQLTQASCPNYYYCGYSNTATAADGTWSASVPPGPYTVVFTFNGYATQYWKHTSNQYRAQNILVKAGGVTPAINAALVKVGAITGTVTGPSGAPMAGAVVHVQWPGTGSDFYSTQTDNSGNYQLTNLPPGSFLVWFSASGYSNVYYPAASTPQGAALVTVRSGKTVAGINATIQWPSGTGPGLPTVTSVSPATGPARGGTTVTVTGTNLGGAAVDFGLTPGSNIVVNAGGTSLTVSSPAESVGSVDITVTTVAGTSAVVAADTYTFT